MTIDTTTALRRTEIRSILRAHVGSVSRIAKNLGIRPQTVSLWLYGKTTSARIAEAANNEALRLRDQKKSTA